MTDEQVPDVFDIMNEVEHDVAPFGFPLIGEIVLQYGWAAMPYGAGAIPQEDKWFPFDPGQDAEHTEKRKAQREACAKKIADQGWVNKKNEPAIPIACLAIITRKDTELTGWLSNWKTDLRFDTVMLGSPGYKKETKPSMQVFKDAGIANPFVGSYWAHTTQVADPSGRETTDAQGRVRPTAVPVIRAIFPDGKAEAEAYMLKNDLKRKTGEVAPAEQVKETVPQGFTPASWKGIVSEIQAELAKGKQTPAEVAAIAADYGVDVKWVDQLKTVK